MMPLGALTAFFCYCTVLKSVTSVLPITILPDFFSLFDIFRIVYDRVVVSFASSASLVFLIFFPPSLLFSFWH